MVLLYEYADGQMYPGIVVSPAPASSIHEPTIPGVEELGFQISPAPASQIHEPTIRHVEEMGFQEEQGMGWKRTALLAAGAGLGVLGTAALIHAAKEAKPELEPKGWTRTGLLAVGGAGGTLLMAGLIHVVKQETFAEEEAKAYRYDLVEES